MHHYTERSFVDEFRWVSSPQYKKTEDKELFFFGAYCKRGRHLYANATQSCFIPTSYCHLSATLQTISIIVVNLQDNRVCFEFLSHFEGFHLTLSRIISPFFGSYKLTSVTRYIVSFSPPLSLSLSHTHKHTHTCTYTYTNTNTRARACAN